MAIGLSVRHLREHVFVHPRYTEEEAREAISASLTWTESLRRLGRCHTGGAASVLKKWPATWEIPTNHLDPNVPRREASRRRGRPLHEFLTEHSTMSRTSLKAALFREGMCSGEFVPKRKGQRYCSAHCAAHAPRARSGPTNPQRKAVRPPYAQVAVRRATSRRNGDEGAGSVSAATTTAAAAAGPG